MDINYSAITGSAIYVKSKKLLDTSGRQKSKFIIMFILGLFIFSGIMFLVSIVAPLTIPVLVVSVFIAFFVFVYKSLIRGSREWSLLQTALSEFAKQNSFVYEKTPFMRVGGENIPDTALTLPFKFRLMTNKGNMKGEFQNLPFEYTCGSIELVDYRGLSAKSSKRESRSLSAFYITLPISLPKLYVDAKYNNIVGFEAGTGAIEEVQKYSLESIFPKFYRVYAQKDDQINVLSILTPEVMDKLLDNKHLDVWIDGNKLVVFALNGPFEYFAGIPVVFPMVQMLLNEIDAIAKISR